MLAKTNRIKKKKEFENIFKNGLSFKKNYLLLKVIKNELGKYRFGFVISQKVSKKAVVRNKIKRRLTEIIRTEFKKNNDKETKSGLDMVFIALPGIDKENYLELKNNLLFLFKKAVNTYFYK